MKNYIKYFLQLVLGYERYLFWFSMFKIKSLRRDKKEKDFFYFMNEVNKEGVILDIGANIGIMTYHLSKHFPERKVFAIEPMPNNLTVLKKIINHYRLNNVEVLPFAVGEAVGELEMILPIDRKVKMQGLAHVVHDSIDEWNNGEKLIVKSITLDGSFLEIPITGIKMDIENFEYFALQGGKAVIEKYLPVIYLELWENENRTKCFQFLEGLGYTAFTVQENSLVLFDIDKHQHQNFIFKVK